MSLLQESSTFVRGEGGVYERVNDRTWWGHDAQFGGYVQALALRAMHLELDAPDMAPVTMGIQFFRPYADGAFRVEVTVLRRGRTMANVIARLFAGGKLAGHATAAFGVRRERAEFVALSPPAELTAGPPADDEVPAVSGLGIPTHDRFWFFPRIGAFAMGHGGAHVGGWVRPREPEPVDEYLMVMLADLWIPAAYHHWRQPVVAVSADIATQFRAAFPADLPPGTPLFVELRTAGSIGGFVDEDSAIWSPRGQLLAQGRQMRYVHA